MNLQKTIVVFLLCWTAACLVPAFGQSTGGELVGTIYDQSGAVLPGAVVLANHLATGVAVSATSTTSGQYRIPNLQVGNYRVTVTASGFTKTELTNISVELNRTATANVTLQVGQAATAVEVSSGVVTIDTTTAQVGTTFEVRQLADFPITVSGSGVINLSLLSAGVFHQRRGGCGQRSFGWRAASAR